MKKIVIFASGSGTNAQNIIQYFQNNPVAKVVAVFCNKPDAKVLERAKNFHVNQFVFTKDDLQNKVVLEKLHQFKPDLIVLAGFLLKFPQSIIESYPNTINIHPALLPNYGGKGMYGMNVHKAVLENKDTETGITIHYVNEHYDEGGVISQHQVNIEDCQTAEEIAAKIHQLEQEYFPQIIHNLLSQ